MILHFYDETSIVVRSVCEPSPKWPTARKVASSTVSVLACISFVAHCQITALMASFWFGCYHEGIMKENFFHSVPPTLDKLHQQQLLERVIHGHIYLSFWNVSLEVAQRFLTKRTYIMVSFFIRWFWVMPNGHDSILHTINLIGILPYCPAIVNLQIINSPICKRPFSTSVFSVW